MAATDERVGTWEVLEVAEIGDVLVAINWLNGDIFVGMTDEAFFKGGTLEKEFRSGVPLFVGVLREFCEELFRLGWSGHGS